MKVNERIRELRTTNRYTLKEVAERIGVSEGTVQRYESGAIVTIPYESIERIADMFDCDPAFVMGWQPEYKKADLKPIVKMDENDVELIKAYHNAPLSVREGIKSILGL